MSIEQEEVVRSFLRDFEGEHLGSTGVERLLGHMAPDARYHVSAWREPFVGHEAIREELLRQDPIFGDIQVELLNFASAGNTVFVERVDWFTMNGKRAGVHAVGVFEVDDSGKVAIWRDYFDGAEIRKKV
jgi:limonene-1,2-epoxide hydrolase